MSRVYSPTPNPLPQGEGGGFVDVGAVGFAVLCPFYVRRKIFFGHKTRFCHFAAADGKSFSAIWQFGDLSCARVIMR